MHTLTNAYCAVSMQHTKPSMRVNFCQSQRNHLMVSVWIVWDHWKDPKGIINGY